MNEAFCISSVITLAIFYTYFYQKMLEIARMVFRTEHFRKWAEQFLLSAEVCYCKCGCNEKSVVMTVCHQIAYVICAVMLFENSRFLSSFASTQRSPSSEAKNSSSSQLPTFFATSRVNVQHNPPISVLCQKNPAHNLPSNFFKMYFDIILPSVLRSSRWSLSPRYFHQNTVGTFLLLRMCCMLCPSVAP